MEKQKYEVKWKADHFAEVKAENETKAFEEAAHYAQEHDTCVDEDEYECRLASEPEESPQIAIVTRDGLNMTRLITITIRGESVIMEDYLRHPVESFSRTHRTVMEAEMLDELIRQLGYVRRGEVES